MIHTVRLITDLSHHKVTFFVVARALSIYSLSKFQIYNTVSLTVITMPHIRFQEFTHLITENLCFLTHLSPFLPVTSNHTTVILL